MAVSDIHMVSELVVISVVSELAGLTEELHAVKTIDNISITDITAFFISFPPGQIYTHLLGIYQNLAGACSGFDLAIDLEPILAQTNADFSR